MKKHLSVLMLANRGVVIKLTLIIVLTSAVQAFLFVTAMGSGVTLEETLEESRVVYAAGVGFLLASAALCTNCCSGCGYTLDRLSVSPRTVLIWWTVNNTAWYIIFWASQTITMLALCRHFAAAADAALVGPQTVFLAFYRNSYLHGLLPLEDGFILWRNLLLFPSLGFASACFSRALRRGRRSISPAVMILGAVLNFRADFSQSGGALVGCFILALFVLSACFWGLLTEGQNEPD